MATDSFKFWDSYYEAIKMVDCATAGRLVMALCGKVFDGIDPDLSDEPMLGMAYAVMLRQAEQSRDLARRAQANGTKSAGRPRKSAKDKPTQKPRNNLGLTKGKEEIGVEKKGGVFYPSGKKTPPSADGRARVPDGPTPPFPAPEPDEAAPPADPDPYEPGPMPPEAYA